MRIGHLRDLLDAAPVRALFTARNVLRDGAGEQQIALHDIADLGAVIILVDHAHVVPVDEDLAVRGRIKADQQFRQRRLARAAAADDGDEFSPADIDADVFQHIGRVVAAIAEVHVLELHVAAQVGQHDAAGRVAGLLFRFDVEHVAETFHRDARVRQPAPQRHQPHQRRQHAAHQGVEGDQLADRQLVVEDEAGAGPQDRDRRARIQ